MLENAIEGPGIVCPKTGNDDIQHVETLPTSDILLYAITSALKTIHVQVN